MEIKAAEILSETIGSNGQESTSNQSKGTELPGTLPEVPAAAVPPQEDDFAKRFAALTRQQKMLLEREKALKAREAELEEYSTFKKLKDENPWEFSKKIGLNLDDVISGAAKDGQEPTLEDQIKQLQKRLDDGAKREQERAEEEQRKMQQAQIDSFKKKINDHIVGDLEKYEMLNLEDERTDLVFDVINTHFAKTMEETGKGEVMDVDKASDLVETFLVNRALRYSQAKKLQSKLAPPVTANPSETETPATKEHAHSATLTQSMTASTSAPAPKGFESPDAAKRRIAQEWKAKLAAQR